MLSTAGPVADPDFAVRVRGVRLERHVEVYQWKEETHTESRTQLGGGEERTTTYKYVRTWSDKPIDSDRFKEPRGHTNPVMTLPVAGFAGGRHAARRLRRPRSAAARLR